VDRAGIALAVTAAAVAAGLLLFAASGPGFKVFAVILGTSALLLGAFLSGNPRLFLLWSLMVSLPLDLSKRFGPVFLKMGGESAFRVEVSDFFVACLLLFLVRDLWSERIRGLTVPKVTYLWLLLTLMGAAWATWGTWRLTAAHETVRMAKVTVLFLVVVNEMRRPRRVYQVATALTVGLLLEAMVGLAQYVTRGHFGLEFLGETAQTAMTDLSRGSLIGESVHRVGAFLNHPNLFGIYLAALLPIPVALFLLRLGPRARLAFLLAAVAGMGALLATLSRSGWLSFATAFAVLMTLMALHGGLRRRSLAAAAVAAVALLLVSGAFAGPILSRLFESRADAMIGRAEWREDAWRMVQARPVLGWGTNSYVFASPPFTRYGRGTVSHYKGWPPAVHNIYFLWWAETGTLGLVLHLAVVGSVVATGVRNLRVRDETLFALNAACLSGMAAFAVDGFFSFSLRMNALLRVFWVLAAIVMAVRVLALKEAASRPPARPRQAGLPRPVPPGEGAPSWPIPLASP
jgi:hypothetical protein